MADQKTCFVVQGYGKKTDFATGRVLDLDKSYNIIKMAVEEAELECIRSDEIPQSGSIDRLMYEQILTADLVIADLSTSNVNAAYELGVRHALRPFTTIVIAEEQFRFPFDLNHIVIRTYRHLGEDLGFSEAMEFKQSLAAAIAEILGKDEVDSPVYTYLAGLRAPVLSAADAADAAPPPAAAGDGAGADGASTKALLDAALAARAAGDWVQAKAVLTGLRALRPHDDFVTQQLALATYKAKVPTEAAALQEALAVMADLGPGTSTDPETLGLWAAIHKRLWEIEPEPAVLDEAIKGALKGFILKQDHYNGINLAFLLDVRAARAGVPADEATADRVRARQARADVVGIAQQRLEGELSDEERYWLTATIWEAHAGLGDESAAAEWEAKAVAIAPESWMVDSTREQLAKLRTLQAAAPP